MRLAARRLAVARGRRTILQGVEAAFAPGRVTAILGPNGAGKSSLLMTLAGLLPPAGGSVELEGRALARLKPAERARAIGYLAQGAELHWDLAVREVVALGRLPFRQAFAGPSAADEAAIDEAMALADLQGLDGRTVQALSGGERARVLLARLLAGQPPVLLADEPLANLDPRHVRDTLALLRSAADAGAAVVLVLHDLAAAARCADHVLLLAEGRVLADGAPADVLRPDLLRLAYGIGMRVWTDSEAGLMIAPTRS